MVIKEKGVLIKQTQLALVDLPQFLNEESKTVIRCVNKGTKGKGKYVLIEWL